MEGQEGHLEFLRSAETALQVLVVDDDQAVRTVMARMLESFGYRAVCACDGQEAIEKYAELRAAGGDVVLALLDLLMPRIDGAAALRGLRGLRADLPVILMSGYSEAEVIGRFAEQEVSGYLQKPFRPAQLHAVLRQALPK